MEEEGKGGQWASAGERASKTRPWYKLEGPLRDLEGPRGTFEVRKREGDGEVVGFR